MINKQDIDKLYQLYEFEKDREKDSCCVYVYDQGYFNNAEIVVYDLKKESEIQSVKEDYINLGYSVSIREARDYKEIKLHIEILYYNLPTVLTSTSLKGRGLQYNLMRSALILSTSSFHYQSTLQ